MYRQVLNTNVVGPFLVSLALLPSLRKKERRTIVQVGTSAAHARVEHAVALLCHHTQSSQRVNCNQSWVGVKCVNDFSLFQGLMPGSYVMAQLAHCPCFSEKMLNFHTAYVPLTSSPSPWLS